MKVGFIGLGNVGGKLAGSLLRNGFDLTVRDLDRDVAQGFLDKGAHWADSPRAMAEGLDGYVRVIGKGGAVDSRLLGAAAIGIDGILAPFLRHRFDNLAHRPKCAPMNGRDTQTFQAGQVLAGGVALVARERVTRKTLIQFLHLPVTGHLGENGGRADGRDLAVSFDDGLNRHGQSRTPVSVHHHAARPAGKALYRPAHGQQCLHRRLQ